MRLYFMYHCKELLPNSSFYLRNLSGLLYTIFCFSDLFTLQRKRAFSVGSLLFSVELCDWRWNVNVSPLILSDVRCVYVVFYGVFLLRVDMKWRKWWAACENEWMNGLSTLSDRFKLVLVHYCQSVLFLLQFQEWKLFLFKDNSYYTSFIGGACVIHFWLSFFFFLSQVSLSSLSCFFFCIWFISVFLNVINEGIVRFKKRKARI